MSTERIKLEPGLYDSRDVDYGAIDAINSSSLKAGQGSPMMLHAAINKSLPPKKSTQMDMGTLCHHLALSPNQPYPAVPWPTQKWPPENGVPWPRKDDGSYHRKGTKAYKAAEEGLEEGQVFYKDEDAPAEEGGLLSANSTEYKAFVQDAESRGLAVMKPGDIRMAELMSEALLGLDDFKGLLGVCPRREQVIVWERAGILFKGIIDATSDECDVLLDVKTTRARTRRQLSREFAKWDMHIQFAMYQDAVRLLFGVQDAPVYVAFVRNEYPIGAAVMRVDDASLAQGWADYQRLTMEYQECRKKGSFPWITRTPEEDPARTMEIGLPPYAIQTDDEDELDF